MGRVFDVIVWGFLVLMLMQVYIIKNGNFNTNYILVCIIMFAINILIIFFFNIKKDVINYMTKKQEKNIDNMINNE